MREIPEINGLDTAFGNIQHLPPVSQIPEKFQNHETPWCVLVSLWFFNGLPKETDFHPKEGVDPIKALRAIAAIMRSFEPKHEHKEAGCAFLLSEWFKKVVIPATEKEPERVFQ